ncbi:hypothetical protein M0R45_036233 [Rubus argutus]|uniref:Uncharacterized protein n=1 Tax=Rubus argutus TaxID=59490 RepID=A0AAW1VZ72_RUBAR
MKKIERDPILYPLPLPSSIAIAVAHAQSTTPHLLCQSPPQAFNSLSLAAAMLSQPPCRQPCNYEMEDKKEPAAGWK